ncbi:MAG: hypothetical protein ABSG46_12560 [Candidatus Binataceae bacterium]|jgi:hypothetical protein
MNSEIAPSMKPVASGRMAANPFPGLRPFHEDEEYLFFGRESQVDAMVNILAATRFLTVAGTSGSGKSSLVNCGLRPALHGGLMAQAGTSWRMAQFRPGSDPMHAMARALAENGVLFRDHQAGAMTLTAIVDATLRMSKLGLIDLYQQANLGEDVNLLVVVDQFEELFRYRQLGAGQPENVSEAAFAFVNLLLEAKAQAAYPIYVVLTMRSDFLGDCTHFPGLAEAINVGQYLVPRMTRDERRAAIYGPIGVGGAAIAPVLLTRLVNDVGDNPDQLSILQHALNRTWARWENESGGVGPLGLEHYEAIGTMAHALDQHAETAYAELHSARERWLCEKLFKALTDKATDPRGVRRPTTLGALCALTDAAPAELATVIDVFREPSRSFLMPPAGEALAAETVIDISHESLMRVWQRLDKWADEEAQSAQSYRRLADSAVLHAAEKASLWRDPELQLALDWRRQSQPNETWALRYHPGFTLAMRFLTQSAEVREAERAAERARFAKRQRVRRLVFGMALLLALGTGLVALSERQKAVAEKLLAAAARQSLLREKTILIWTVGSTNQGGAAQTIIPSELEKRAEALGYQIEMQSFPAQGFAQTFLKAITNPADAPDILAIDNWSVINDIDSATSGHAVDDIGPQPSSLVEIIGSFESLESQQGGWEYLVRPSRNYKKARDLALGGLACNPALAGNMGTSPAASVEQLTPAAIGLAGASQFINVDTVLSELPDTLAENHPSNAGTITVADPASKIDRITLCGLWASAHLSFVYVSVVSEGASALGQQDILVVLNQVQSSTGMVQNGWKPFLISGGVNIIGDLERVLPHPSNTYAGPPLQKPALISPPDQARLTRDPAPAIEWSSAGAGVAAYLVESQFRDDSQSPWGSSSFELVPPSNQSKGMGVIETPFEGVGAQPHRWRVWAIDSAGDGAISGWRVINFTD